ncbi:hypothetical protein GCM10010277_73300 [Streptomyces longisporoflavus]|uniref:hypothetical protein n=1 Tax=Streptomyces longisporoflavus TaxID=28044 RepID=UPI00167C46B8|nr:hypothetical protein [Streptomyces longisporoflavus]GGV65884.1 hypothetical protein GCM10010277_73300 [Streptomyces longisporoflavus]
MTGEQPSKAGWATTAGARGNMGRAGALETTAAELCGGGVDQPPGLGRAARHPIDDALSRGWSVLVRGRARAVSDPGAARRLQDQAYSSPRGRRTV